MKRLQDTFTLTNGVKIPCVGFGTYKMSSGENTVQAIENALACGYRHIDTAAFYENEHDVGEALRRSEIKREAVFVTSKLWRSDRGYHNALRAFERSLNELGLEYMDLYLIHWPAPKKDDTAWEKENLDTWQALIELYNAKKVRAIGVSNFLEHHLSAIMQSPVLPMVNQIQIHPGWWQAPTVEFCQKNGILIEAWSPLGRGAVLNEPTLLALSAKYAKTTAQLCVRWCLQKGILPLPKTVSQSRMQENASVFDFVITPDDMQKMDEIQLVNFHAHHPDRL